jgi:hypothetical protein
MRQREAARVDRIAVDARSRNMRMHVLTAVGVIGAIPDETESISAFSRPFVAFRRSPPERCITMFRPQLEPDPS